MTVTAETETAQVKYVFLDIESFTQGRSVEDMSIVIGNFNKIVSDALNLHKIDAAQRILLPTGDGICIGLLDNKAYDIHLKISLSILAEAHKYSAAVVKNQHKFKVRIGINENIDNLIIDINGQKNLAGDGINTAQRIMSFADGGQIIIGHAVHNVLHKREKYVDAFTKFTKPDKHGTPIDCYQFIQSGHFGLNINPPYALAPVSKDEPKLSLRAAYYFAHSVVNFNFFKEKNFGIEGYCSVVLLYFLARDSVKMRSHNTYNDGAFTHDVKDFGSTLSEQFEMLKKVKFKLIAELARKIDETLLDRYNVTNFLDSDHKRLISEKGLEKLKNEWPDICKEFGLN